MSRKKYTKEFKLEAVRLVTDQGLSPGEASKNLGIAQSTLNGWVEKYHANGGDAFPGSGRGLPSDQRNRDLEKQLKRVTMERDILKKAIGFFTENQK